MEDRPEERGPEAGGPDRERAPGSESARGPAGDARAAEGEDRPGAGPAEGEDRPGARDGGDDRPEPEPERSRRSPWSSLGDLQETVGEIVDAAIRNVSPAAARSPRYDLVELPDAYWLLMDLPGVPRSELDVTTSGEELTVSGRRPRPELPEEARIRSGERAFGRFRRAIRIPPDVDAGGIAAKLEEGVLRVTLPRRAGAETQRVDVR